MIPSRRPLVDLRLLLLCVAEPLAGMAGHGLALAACRTPLASCSTKVEITARHRALAFIGPLVALNMHGRAWIAAGRGEEQKVDMLFLARARSRKPALSREGRIWIRSVSK